ncbi:hypothetical protein M5D96_013060 [Drosophila gunungcola]|uniref:Uncharacterized protein n=1 Tax=Drosophila gunungcola TaxID=103775 RepID=A0A9P9YBZ8_9MUSC|nr:hypothetical protein M5D96_013060 [Drosophila gunungcola]
MTQKPEPYKANNPNIRGSARRSDPELAISHRL